MATPPATSSSSRWGPPVAAASPGAATSSNNPAVDLTKDDLELITDVEWAGDSDDPFGTGELAEKPKWNKANQDVCGCILQEGETTKCHDMSCVLFACQEECPVSCGPSCGNQRLSRKEWKQVQVFDAGHKGRGLKVMEPVQEGDFIIEYVGRAIRKEYLDKLFQRYKQERMLYIMALDRNTYLDARTKGGLARFINHSCEPNARVERWKVKGVLRAGVFALRDLQMGEELTFDYKWDRKRGRSPTKCHCLTPSCRGTLEMPKSMEEDELERKLMGHWKKPFQKKAGREIINRSIQILSEQHHEYFSADVCKYDEASGKHLVMYRHDLEEVWEDLSAEDWMILDEEAEQFVIAKKKIARSVSGSLLGENREMMEGDAIQAKKNYILVQTPVKDQFLSKHLLDRCQSTCHVTIDVEQLTNPEGLPPLPAGDEDEGLVEQRQAFEASKDGLVWKLSVSGYHIAKALMILEKNVAYIEKLLNAADPTSGPGSSGGEEVIIPRCIVDQVKRRLPIIRDKCRSVNVMFAHSESKSKRFSRLILESALVSDLVHAKEQLWTQLVAICVEVKAPISSSGIYKDFGFLGGELSSEQFQLLIGEEKNKLKQEYSEDLRRSTFFNSFESTQRCTIWIQSEEDMGRIDANNVVVGVASPNAPRKVYLGCAPKDIPRLWELVQVRAAELARGVRYLHLGKDRMYQQFMMQKGGQFFQYIRSITGVSVTVDSMTGDHLRIDGRTPDQPSLNNSPWPESGRVAVAEELIRLQIELYRDHCIRQQNWIFGRDWSLIQQGTSSDESTTSSSTAARPVTPTGRKQLDPRLISTACLELADINSSLELSGAVAAHAAVIMYRFASVVAEQDNPTHQMRTRDLLLGSLFIANKAQKAMKWKKLDALLEAAYNTFYPGATFDSKNEEVLVLEKRVLSAEKEILETLQYDIFWQGVDWIPAAASQIAEPLARNALDLATSGPALAAGSTLWLKYGIEYIFAAVAGFLSIDLEKLCPALSLIPLKVSQAAEIIANSVGANSNGRKGSSNAFFGGKEALQSQVPNIREACIRCMSKGIVPGSSSDPRRSSEVSARYQLIGNRNRRQRVFHSVPSSLVKERILLVIDGVCAESNCRILIGDSVGPGVDDVTLEGSWRAVAIAEYLVKAACGGYPVPLPEPVDKIAEEDRSSSLQAKLHPGLINMDTVNTADGWNDTIQSKVLDDSGTWGRKVGGKCCLAGRMSESSVRDVGLRWWIPPRYGPSASGSVSDMFCIRSTSADQSSLSSLHIRELGQLAQHLVGQNGASRMFPSLIAFSELGTEESGDRFAAVSLQRWPSEKVENREKGKISKKSTTEVGFSAAALQEMQILTQLHALIPSPQGHPNFILPIAVAIPQAEIEGSPEKKVETKAAAGQSKAHEDIFSLFRSSEENEKVAEKEKKRKEMATGPHIIFHPTPFVMQRFMSRSKRRKGSDAPDKVKMLSPAIVQAWFHDLLSSLVHCHTNHVVLRALQPDQIVVDHSGVAKLGGMYRATVLSGRERRKSPDPLESARSRKGKQLEDISADEVANNSFIAPEILMGSVKHTKETDIWSIGCLLAQLILSKPLFLGKDRKSLLVSQFKIVGSPRKHNYERAEKFPFYTKPPKSYKRGVRKALVVMMGEEDSAKYKLALDLLDQMLHLDPKQRITAVDALKHEYMAEYMEKCNTDSFRHQYVQDWLALKHRLMQSSKSADREESKDLKRKAMMMTASNFEDDDDLYDMGDLLGGKQQKLD